MRFTIEQLTDNSFRLVDKYGPNVIMTREQFEQLRESLVDFPIHMEPVTLASQADIEKAFIARSNVHGAGYPDVDLKPEPLAAKESEVKTVSVDPFEDTDACHKCGLPHHDPMRCPAND